MAASKEIRSYRAEKTLEILNRKSRCVFLTLTTPDVVDYKTVRERWRNLRHWLVRRLGKPQYIMNYELHPKGHGWHIHAVFTCYIPLKKHLQTIRSFGFGRVGVEIVYSQFVSDYLMKHCLKAYRGIIKSKRIGDYQRMRLVNQSRGLPPLSDYKYVSDYLKSFSDVCKILKPKIIKSKIKLLSELPYYFGFSSFNESLDYFNNLLTDENREY